MDGLVPYKKNKKYLHMLESSLAAGLCQLVAESGEFSHWSSPPQTSGKRHRFQSIIVADLYRPKKELEKMSESLTKADLDTHRCQSSKGVSSIDRRTSQ